MASAGEVSRALGGGFGAAASHFASKQAQAAGKDAAELERLRARVAKSSARLAEVGREAKRRDWTASYRAWDEWEDPDEVDEFEKAHRARLEGQKQRAQYGGCSHDHSAERAVYELSTADKIRDCKGFKLAGNFFYREGQFFRAAEKYRRILIYFEYAFPDTEEETAALASLRLDALLNLAACKLRTKQHDEVIKFASQAVRMAPENLKALYRRAQAYRHKDDFDAAAADIKKAIKLAPTDTLLRRELALLRNKIAAYKRNSKRVFQIMIGGGTGAHKNRSAQASSDPDPAGSSDATAGASITDPTDYAAHLRDDDAGMEAFGVDEDSGDETDIR